MPQLQLAYRHHRGAERAPLIVLSDTDCAIDRQQVILLRLLYLCAAFDLQLSTVLSMVLLSGVVYRPNYVL